MTVTQKHPLVRWAIPAAALAVIGGGVAMTSAHADAGLPPKTAEQLLVALQTAKVETFEGTVSTKVDLGLGALPTSTSRTTDFTNLANGSSTVRVWADGTTKQRVALLGEAGEADVIRNGSQVWLWNAEKQTAEHSTLSSAEARTPSVGPTRKGMPATPQEAASQVLKALDPSTTVATSGFATVAGRDAYALTLTPRTTASLVKNVVIDVDGATSMPLRVTVTAKGSDSPAVDVGFTEFSTGTPAASTFTFTPPKGATVTEAAKPASGTARAHTKTTETSTPAHVTVGKGWAEVLVTRLPADALASGSKSTQNSTRASGTDDQSASLAGVLAALPTQHGTWGSGKVFEGTLFSAVLTSDGRLAVGAVPAGELENALATSAAKALATAK